MTYHLKTQKERKVEKIYTGAASKQNKLSEIALKMECQQKTCNALNILSIAYSNSEPRTVRQIYLYG